MIRSRLGQGLFAPGAKLPLACAFAVVAALLIAIPYRIAQSGYLTDVSGAWAALADDVAHGVLYRPLVSELGYGGTRYFPLHIVLHGGLSWLGLSVRFAGHVVSLLSAVLLVVAGAHALRKRGATPEWAIAIGLLTLASRTAFMAVGGIRGDLLAVALGVLGLALVPIGADPVAPPGVTRTTSIVPASLCFALALLAKPTLAWAPAGAFVALIFQGQLRPALKMTLIVGGITGVGLGLAQLASHGAMLASFQAFGSGGGFSLRKLLGSVSFVRPGEGLWIAGGVVVTLLRLKQSLRDPIGAAVLIGFLVTLALYTGEGIHINHLIDSVVLGALALGMAVVAMPSDRWPTVLWTTAAVLGVLEASLLDAMVLKRGELEQAAAAIPAGDAPILSEQPWIPILAGERVFMVDAFNLAHMRLTTPSVDRDLLERLDQCRFRAVVLIGPAHRGDWWYRKARFGVGFTEHLLANYSYRGVVGAHAIYLPQCGVPERDRVAVSEPAGELDTVLARGGKPNALKATLTNWLHGK
ncbi:MAG TPA: hypothetical protein VHM25_26825 [Polyangiaceae bacterium]|jgi:hypothetical protein|nr:hypothetical protein [Polyangiaceae bacterium]